MNSTCCNAEIEYSGIERSNGSPHKIRGVCLDCGKDVPFADPTPPTSTEVEEILEKFWKDRFNFRSKGRLKESSRKATQAITHLIAQSELRGRIDEWEILGDYLTEADKLAMSKSFMAMYKIHGDNLQDQLDQLGGNDE